MNTFEVRVRADEFNLPLCVQSGQTFRWGQSEGGEWVGVDGPHWYVVKVSPEGLSLQSNGAQADFMRLFQLEVSLPRLHRELVSKVPGIQPYLASTPGLRLLRPSSRTESLFSFLCTSNNHLVRIDAMVKALARRGSALAQVGEQTLFQFPSIQQLAQLTEAELRSEGFGYRGATIPKVAQQLLEQGGEEFLDRLATEPYEQGIRILQQLPGIGPKLAECIALYALHHSEAVPVDTHMWQSAVREFFPEWSGLAPTHRRMAQVGERLRSEFGKDAGWAQLYYYFGNRQQQRIARSKMSS